MKFFIDTANLEEIKETHRLGLIDGVTTNPTLVSKEGIEGKEGFRNLVEEICNIVDGPVSAEVVSTEEENMVHEARDLAKIHPNIVVKIPMTKDGIKAVRRLKDYEVNTNVTLVFSPIQALIAAKAGATYVSPFIGRLDDISHEGMEIVEKIDTIFDNYQFDTEIIVASIRHPLHVLEAALIGADIATIPYKVIEQIFIHPLTDIGIKRFLKDWEKAMK
jgi:transaldolase